MIFDAEPSDWKQLQRLVCQAFREMGCRADENVSIELVRGKKAVDVLVQDSVDGISSSYLVECKHWSCEVHQGVVHEFRPIVADAGVNRGLIVSKKGFQAGCFEAAKKHADRTADLD